MSLSIATVEENLFCLLPNMPLDIFESIRARRRIGHLITNDTTAATLSDHLLRSMLIAQHCATSVDGHQAVKVLNRR